MRFLMLVVGADHAAAAERTRAREGWSYITLTRGVLPLLEGALPLVPAVELSCEQVAAVEEALSSLRSRSAVDPAAASALERLEDRLLPYDVARAGDLDWDALDAAARVDEEDFLASLPSAVSSDPDLASALGLRPGETREGHLDRRGRWRPDLVLHHGLHREGVSGWWDGEVGPDRFALEVGRLVRSLPRSELVALYLVRT